MERRAEGIRAIQRVVAATPERCRVIERAEPRQGQREELEKGVQGVIRWKGLDADGQFCAVIETGAGAAYHLPLSDRVAQQVRVGEAVDLKRALDKDQRIEEVAKKQEWAYDVTALSEASRDAFVRRLEQLERMGLATREGHELWRLRSDFRAELAKGKAQPYWQMLSLRSERQPLAEQPNYAGHVWLDRVRTAELGWAGFGRQLRNSLERRHEYLRSIGLDPADPKLRWKLWDLQRDRLEGGLSASGSGSAVRPRPGFEGVLHVHEAKNGERFVEIRAEGRFVISAAARGVEGFEGRRVRLEMGSDRRARFVAIDPRIEKDKDRG